MKKATAEQKARESEVVAWLIVKGASANELRQWLMEKWQIPMAQANWISMSACGNVRQALLQAGNWLTLGEIGELALPTVNNLRRNKAA